jgi:hypothetical protein
LEGERLNQMKIKGYSERGVVNSLFYEISYARNSTALLDQFISLIEFPKYFQDFKVTGASIYIEPSFSDFGQGDVVLLIENLYRKQSLFIEADVKTASKKEWKIQDEFERFVEDIREFNYASSRSTVYYANLFVKLYYKQRMTEAMKRGGMEAVIEGVEFPACFGKKKRKIGSNETVRRTAEELSGYLDDSFFVLLVPDLENNLREFFNDISFNLVPAGLQEWDTGNWGYLTWEKVKEFCRRNRMTDTLDNFDHNRGQID